jgi:hypothetical protein
LPALPPLPSSGLNQSFVLVPGTMCAARSRASSSVRCAARHARACGSFFSCSFYQKRS